MVVVLAPEDSQRLFPQQVSVSGRFSLRGMIDPSLAASISSERLREGDGASDYSLLRVSHVSGSGVLYLRGGCYAA